MANTVKAVDRLSRLLALVPYLLDKQGVEIEAVADHFGISIEDVVNDLQLLFVCGTPGHYPDDLIEAEWESGRIFLSNADALAKPLRLSNQEAVTLLAGLNVLAQSRYATDNDALASVQQKLLALSEGACADGPPLQLDADAGRPGILAVCEEAIDIGRVLHLTYFVASRDEVTKRTVDPIVLTLSRGFWYLDAWCHTAQDRRLFRLDRVFDATIGDKNVSHHNDPSQLPDEVFRGSHSDITVRARLAPTSSWVVEQHPMTVIGTDSDDSIVLEIQVGSVQWLTRLVLSLGGDLVVLEPPEVVKHVRETAIYALSAQNSTIIT